MLRLLLLAFAFLALASASAAQPIVTDRPDFTESPLAVEPGRIQIEFGATFQETADDFQRFNAPEALARIGVLGGVELRLGLPEYVRVEADGPPRVVREDASEPSIGAKLELGEASGIPLGLIVESTIPVLNGVDLEEAAQTVILTGSADLSERFSLGSQIQGTYNDTPETLDLGATLVLGFSVDDQIGTFAEFLFTRQASRDPGTELVFHTGATVLLTEDFQLDAHGGIGLTGESPRYLLGVGASARF